MISTRRRTLERSTLAPSRDRRASFVGKYSTPIVEGHSLLAGWDLGANRSTSSNRVVETNLAAPPIDTLEDYTANVRKFAFFAQDEWNVTPNWSVYAGFHLGRHGTTTSGDGIATTTNRSSVASPLFQTLWKLPDKSGRQFRLALTRTYKAPETNSLVPRISRVTVNTSTTPDYQMGNPALKPELATGVDVAYEHFFAKGASMSLSGSVRALTDYNTRGIFLVDGRWINRPFNNGNATSKSIEFDAKFPLQTLYPAAPPIDFRFNIARNFSHVDEVPGPNNRLDQQVPVSGTLGLDYRMRGGMVTAGASYSFKSGGDVRLTTNQIDYTTPKRELEMYVLYKYTPKLQFRARLANVLRQDTVTASTYFDETGSTKTVSIRPTQMNIGASVKLWIFERLFGNVHRLRSSARHASVAPSPLAGKGWGGVSRRQDLQRLHPPSPAYPLLASPGKRGREAGAPHKSPPSRGRRVTDIALCVKRQPGGRYMTFFHIVNNFKILATTTVCQSLRRKSCCIQRMDSNNVRCGPL